MKRGRFVVLEGGEAGGKSTQAAWLAARLRDVDVPAVTSFEPGATAAGAVIRQLVLHSDHELEPLTEALLMAADRAQHVREVVAPALAAGQWVVCDRFLPSSLVYQGVVRGLGVDVIDEINARALGDVSPDLVLVLDVGDDVVASRAGVATDRLEAEGATFHAAVRAAYRELARARGWVLLDGDGSVEAVAARVWRAVEPLLPG